MRVKARIWHMDAVPATGTRHGNLAVEKIENS
jgi:hypothetical protein